MNTTNTKKIIFWGSVWGIIEATLGWFLHFIHLPGKGIILASLGIICMMNGVMDIKKSGVALRIACIAALIKLTNMLFPVPVLFAYHVINPTISILLEGLLVAAFCQMFLFGKKKNYTTVITYAGSVGFMLIYCILFRGWQELMQLVSYINPYLQRSSCIESGMMLTLHAFITGSVLFGTYWVLSQKKVKTISVNLNWGATIALFIVAIVINVML